MRDDEWHQMPPDPPVAESGEVLGGCIAGFLLGLWLMLVLDALFTCR